MAATISLFDLANLSIGHPGPGAVNFTALHSLLHAVLRHLGIQQVLTERRPELLEPGARPDLGPGPEPTPYRRLEQQLLQVERQVQELSRLPSAVELLQRSRQDGKAVSDVWNLLQLRKSTELNREGVDKAMSMMEELMQEMNYLKKFKTTIEDRIKDINKNIDSVTNQMDLVNEVLKKTPEDRKQFVSWKALQSTLVDTPADPPHDVEPSLTSQVLAPALDAKADTDASQTPEASKVSVPQETQIETQAVPTITQPSEGLPVQVHEPSVVQKRAGSAMLFGEGAELYPDTISALQRIRRASDYQPLLDQRVSALEKAFSELASSAMDGEVKGIDGKSEQQVTSTEEADCVKPADDVTAQISDLRDMVKNIDEELKELRRFQPSSTKPGGHMQQQLDKLGSVLEKIMSSSCALLGMSLGLETESTCPVCSLDVSQDASNLCQRFQKLQETVNVLVDSAGEGAQDGGVLGQFQTHIEQLQAECEKLNSATTRLLEDDRLQQRNIESLFDSLSRLETKCGEGSISQGQFDAVTNQLNRMIEGLLNKICAQEKDWTCVLERLTAEVECKLDRIELDPLKKQLEERWRSVRRQLQDQRGPPEGAAGLRKQLISHFHCLSCDRPLDIKVPCSPTVISLPLPNYPTSGHRPQRSDLDPTRRRSKGERIADLMENFPTTARSCGGSHTLTYAHYRRCPKLYEPYPTTAPDEDHSAKRGDSPMTMVTDSQNRGRSSCKLPSIGGRDGSRSKPARCPSQRSSATKLCSSRLPSAHFPTVMGSGNYFASHFIMGGETFDSAHPEGYLFGENSDLNFLGARPVTFPYAAPPPQDPVKTLRSLISIRKDTLRLVRCTEELKALGDDSPKPKISYNVEFTFDADARVAITIYYQATEEFQNGCASYTSKDCSLQSETVHYKRGVCQQFCLPTHTIDPSDWMEEELGCNADGTVYPMVIHAVVDEGEEHLGHSHVLLTTFDKNPDGNCSVKPLKQKQVVDGVIYLLQEIYGIENKSHSLESKVPDDELSDNSAECVVCLSDVRDTLILPCRHLCLCNACADTLRYQANNCPICRLPFRALLQIRAMRKKLDGLSPGSYDPIIAAHLPEPDDPLSSDRVPHGYEVVSLLEALNGPLTPPSAPPVHLVRNGHAPCPRPSIRHSERTLPVHVPSPTDHGTEGNAAFHLKESEFRSLSRDSSLLEEDEERCGSDGEGPTSPQKQPHQEVEVEVEDPGETPESENVTLSSSGAIDPSSRTPTALSSSTTSPEEPSSSLAQSVMSMASSQLSTDTISSMSGSYLANGTDSLAECDPEERLTLPSAEEEEEEVPRTPMAEIGAGTDRRDSEGNAVAEEQAGAAEHESSIHGWWGPSVVTPVCDNNNEPPGLMGLDNDPCPEVTAPGTPVSEDRSSQWSSTPCNADLDQAGDPSPVYGPLAV
ncbi:uncharacterized protein LOC127579956 isoform X2 [Pristis pectinata]|uniref:uncharacterized protein LOC127579956 isoform X2 n=1 Tax=Pristis pectinata TaxID=685728 RepID=UPI00223C91DF|nr:uncharacterized protein LOC127579956 isoform X2 [Pristis pectinata]